MRKIIAICAGLLVVSSACDKNTGINCTEEFRTIGITVNGVTLEEYFTIRNTTGDTLRHDEFDLGNANSTTYTVLTDAFLPELKNKQEVFTFQGYIGNNRIVNEAFLIKADECHIELLSGQTTVNL